MKNYIHLLVLICMMSFIQGDDIPIEIKSQLVSKLKSKLDTYSVEKYFDQKAYSAMKDKKGVYDYKITKTSAEDSFPEELEYVKEDLINHFSSKKNEVRLFEFKNFTINKSYTGNHLTICRYDHIHIIGSSYYEKRVLYYYYIKVDSYIMTDDASYVFQEISRKFLEYQDYLTLNNIRFQNEERVQKEKEGKKTDTKSMMFENIKDMIKERYDDKIRAQNFYYTTTRDGYSNSTLKLLGNMVRTVKVVFITFTPEELPEIIKNYDLPETIQTELELLAYQKKVYDRKVLNYKASPTLAAYEEIIGEAVKEKETIFLAYGRGKSEAKLYPIRLYAQNIVECRIIVAGDKKCDFFNFKGLKKRTYLCCPYKEFGYTDEEENAIKEAFSNYIYQGILRKLYEIETSQTFISSDVEILSDNKKYIAKMNDNGMIYVGNAARKDSLFKEPLYKVGESQPERYKPYGILISESGQLFILNSLEERVWNAKMIRQSKEKPFKLILTDEGDLKLIDNKNQVVSNLRTNQ